MKLKLQRLIFSNKSIIGVLSVDETAFCFTLEPKGKEITTGKYKVILNHSNRFARTMPLVVGVQGREGIRFHWGNKPEDSDGCILTATIYDFNLPDFIGYSKIVFEKLFALMLQAEDNEEEIILEVI